MKGILSVLQLYIIFKGLTAVMINSKSAGIGEQSQKEVLKEVLKDHFIKLGESQEISKKKHKTICALEVEIF